MSTVRAVALGAFAVAALVPMRPAGAQPTPANGAIDACAQIESAVERLDCYDELARRPAEPAPPRTPDPAATAPVERSRSREAPEARPAAVPPAVQREPRPSRRAERRAEREEGEFTDRVAEVREILPGRLEITLASGQVWRQTNSDRYNLQPGHEVRLYPSGFGQYYRLVSIELRSFIQVQRVR